MIKTKTKEGFTARLSLFYSPPDHLFRMNLHISLRGQRCVHSETGPEACRAHVASAALAAGRALQHKRHPWAQLSLQSRHTHGAKAEPHLTENEQARKTTRCHCRRMHLWPPPTPPHLSPLLRRQRVSGSEVLMQLLSGETLLFMSSPIFSPDINLLFLSAMPLTQSLSECFLN